jgi:hypothetical protein
MFIYIVHLRKSIIFQLNLIFKMRQKSNKW